MKKIVRLRSRWVNRWTHRGPMRRGFAPAVESIESRVLLSTPTINEYPAQGSTGLGPENIVTGPNGTPWFTESGNYIGYINPTTHAVTAINLGSTAVGPTNIIYGPKGDIWFNEVFTNDIAQLDPTTDSVVATYHISDNGLDAPNELLALPGGHIWFSTNTNAIGVLDTSSGTSQIYPLPAGEVPTSVTADASGNLWYTDVLSNSIGTFNTTTHASQEFKLATLGANPQKITPGPDGNLWFTENGAAKVGEIHPTTGVIQDFSLPTGVTSPAGIVAGTDGNLWFTTFLPAFVGNINPTTDAISTYTVPDSNAALTGITSTSNGNLWFMDGQEGVGEITPQPTVGTQLVVRTQPPDSVGIGAQFGLTVAVESGSYVVDTSFNGTVTVEPGSGPVGASLGGSLTATAVNGVATFTGLSLNEAGSGYTLTLSANGIAPEPAVLAGATTTTINVVPNDTTTTVSVLPSGPIVGQQVTVTATVAPTSAGIDNPTGVVSFYNGTTLIGTGNLSTSHGVTSATVSFSPAAVGTLAISAAYGGDINDNSSLSGTTSVIVGQDDTTTSISAGGVSPTYGQSVTLTATIAAVSPGAGTPTGLVTFLDGSQTLGTGMISTLAGVSTATFTTADLSATTHAIKAEYGGDSNDLSSDSGILDVVVAPVAATLTLGGLSFTYDGAAQGTTVTTSPVGLSGVSISYSLGGTTVAAPLQAGSYLVTASLVNANYSAPSVSGTLVIGQATPVISWTPPASVVYGTALTSTQLDASASVSTGGSTVNVQGQFVYNQPAGTVLATGADQSLSVTFTPTDLIDYTGASGSTTITVTKATPTIAWSNPADITYGTAIGAAQLNAVIGLEGPDQTMGTVTYSVPSGTVPHAGSEQPITVNVAATANYNATSATVYINVNKLAPVLSWGAPGAIVYGTALSASQLDATSSIGGTFAYQPATGTVLNAGAGQTLTAVFTPTDSVDYSTVSVSTTIGVSPAPLTVTAADANWLEGEALPTFTATYKGFVNGDGPGVLGGTLSFVTNANPSVAGRYTIVPLGLSSTNYAITYQPGVLSLAPVFHPQVLPAPVEVTGLQWEKVKVSRKKSAQELVIKLSGSLNPTDAVVLPAYSLDLGKKVKKLGVQYTKPVPLNSVNYNSVLNEVILTLRGSLPSKTVQLTINAALVQDPFGRQLDGNGDGIPGGNFVALLNRSGRIG